MHYRFSFFNYKIGRIFKSIEYCEIADSAQMSSIIILQYEKLPLLISVIYLVLIPLFVSSVVLVAVLVLIHYMGR